MKKDKNGQLRTDRGFRYYATINDGNLYDSAVYVQEDSVAFKGAHVAIRICHKPKSQAPEEFNGFLVMPVTNARKLRDALNRFIVEAERDELTEPVTYPLGAESWSTEDYEKWASDRNKKRKQRIARRAELSKLRKRKCNDLTGDYKVPKVRRSTNER